MIFNSDPNLLPYIKNQLQNFITELPDVSVSIITQSLVAITCAVLSIWVLNQSAAFISKIQRSVYQSKLSYVNKNRIGTLLKKLKPNSAWLFTLIFAEIVNLYLKDNIFFRVFFFDLLYLYVAYKLILLVCNYSIESPYITTNRFISKSILEKIQAETQRFSILATLFCIPIIYDWDEFLSFEGGLFLLTACLLLIFRTYYSIIDSHKNTFIKFIANQLPSEYKDIQFDFNSKKSHAIFIILLLTSHLIKGILKIHSKLLFIQPYKKVTAKVLWMHLEQKQSAADDGEEIVSDERYELWFSQNFEPNEIIQTENIEFFNKEFNEIIDHWIQEKISENDLLVRGDAGIGKTTLIKNWLKHSKHNELAHFITVPPKGYTEKFFLDLITKAVNTDINSIDELIAFDKGCTKQLFIFDNCENFFLSTIGGFDCFKSILSIINLPLKNIFWVFVIGNESHIYLNDVFGRLNQYSHRITIKAWKSEEIRELVMSRHKASRRKLTFDDLLFASIGNNDELSSYSATADRCFLLLAEQSNSNPSLALNAWTKAASKKENFTIEIGLPEKPSTSFLNDYNADLLFIYASLIKHKNLTTSEAAESTRQNHSVAQRAFKLGIDNGFLYSDDNGRFYMHMYWQSQIINFLRIKNHLNGS